MKKLAKALLELDWQDMDAFAQTILSIAFDGNGKPEVIRGISRDLIDFANDVQSEALTTTKGPE